MTRHLRQFSAFTLIEIMIVVVILGILAAIAVPSFNNPMDAARIASMRSLLQTVREQFEVYKAQHNEKYPPLNRLWDCMTERTDADGNADPNGRFGPYLSQPPRNPYTLGLNVVAAGTGMSGDGWEYDEATGAITAVAFDKQTGTLLTVRMKSSP